MKSDCTITTYAIDKDGYGLVTIEGTKQKHHRLAYCAANNVTMDSIAGRIVRHTCDNPSCVNPKHLLLGSHQDNTQDMWNRNRQNVPSFVGTKNPTAKLTEDDVREIRKLARRSSYDSVAELYGVKKATIWNIMSGRTWKHVV